MQRIIRFIQGPLFVLGWMSLLFLSTTLYFGRLLGLLAVLYVVIMLGAFSIVGIPDWIEESKASGIKAVGNYTITFDNNEVKMNKAARINTIFHRIANSFSFPVSLQYTTKVKWAGARNDGVVLLNKKAIRNISDKEVRAIVGHEIGHLLFYKENTLTTVFIDLVHRYIFAVFTALLFLVPLFGLIFGVIGVTTSFLSVLLGGMAGVLRYGWFVIGEIQADSYALDFVKSNVLLSFLQNTAGNHHWWYCFRVKQAEKW